MEDDRTVDSYKVDEKKFIVVMGSKQQQATEATTSEAKKETESKESSSKADAKPTEAKPKEEPKIESEPSGAAAPAQPNPLPSIASASDSIIMSGEAFENTVQNIMAMGYDKPEVERALRASFNNPDRAVEYLLMGFPEGLEDRPSSAAAGDVGIDTGRVPEAVAGEGMRRVKSN